MTEPTTPVDLDGTPLNEPAIHHPGWSRNLLNQRLRVAWRAKQPAQPYTTPQAAPTNPDETALRDAFTRQGLDLPDLYTADAILTGVHLFGLRHLAPTTEPTTPDPAPFTPTTPTGWDARRSHDTTRRTVTLIDPHGLKYDDRGAAAIRILETLRDTLAITIEDWPDVTQQTR